MDSRKGRINYFVSPKKLYEETGFEWRGEKTVRGLLDREKEEERNDECRISEQTA